MCIRDSTSAPLMNEEWPHIINRKHFDRLVRLLGSGAITHGGQIDPNTLRISPTILTDCLLYTSRCV